MWISLRRLITYAKSVKVASVKSMGFDNYVILDLRGLLTSFLPLNLVPSSCPKIVPRKVGEPKIP
jgi:hypothetical protein